MTNTILAIAETRNGSFRKVSFEVFSVGRTLADQLNANLIALVAGHNIGPSIEELQGYGVDKIIQVDDAMFSSCDMDAHMDVALELIQQLSPGIILCGASCWGKELLAGLSARLNVGMISDCTDIEAQGGMITYTRPVFGGKLNAKMILESRPQMATIRPNVFNIKKKASTAVIESLSPSLKHGRCELVEEKLSKSKAVDLTEADIVVAGGRGTNGDFRPIEELAGILNGAVAASRTVIDEGWRPHREQVGQTGVVVSPNLYIACGISGAVQHFAGMSGSKIIVAVNKDAGAPIFSKSDYGIVGDLFEIIPALIDELKAIKE